MSDAELVKRLLDFDKVTVGDARDAALRIEELGGKIARAERAKDALEGLRPVWAQGWTDDSMAAQASGNALAQLWEMLGVQDQTQAVATLKALTEQLEAARADAKEAEAYADELAVDQVYLCRQLIAAEDKLAKAVEALRAFKDFDDMPTSYKRPDVFELRVRRKLLATLAEIEGTNAP
jgi:hypothetical protein